MRRLTAREFNRDVSAAKRLARDAPVVVTDRGRPTHVLMTVEAYRSISGRRESIIDLLAVPGGAPPIAARDRLDR